MFPSKPLLLVVLIILLAIAISGSVAAWRICWTGSATPVYLSRGAPLPSMLAPSSTSETTSTFATAYPRMTMATTVASSTAYASTGLAPGWVTYTNKEEHYSIQYDPSWKKYEGLYDTQFYLSKDDPIGPFFDVGVNTDAAGGVAAVAYDAITQGEGSAWRKLTPDATTRSDVCGIRNYDNVYIQRGDVLYLISASGGSDGFGNSLALPRDMQPLFEAFVSSFSFEEPWKEIPLPSPSIPTPQCRGLGFFIYSSRTPPPL